MATDLTDQVLNALSQTDEQILSADAFPSTPSSEVKGALDSLKSREMVGYETINKEEAVLTPEGEDVVANGSPEAKVFEAVVQAVEGMKIPDIQVRWLKCVLARLYSPCHTYQYDRMLLVRRLQRLAWVKPYRSGGSGRTGMF